MASKKENFKLTVRDALIANSNLRPSGTPVPDAIRTGDPKISRNLAIEARRKELHK